MILDGPGFTLLCFVIVPKTHAIPSTNQEQNEKQTCLDLLPPLRKFSVSTHPNISMHNLHADFYIFPKVLITRIYLTIKSLFGWWSWWKSLKAYLSFSAKVWCIQDFLPSLSCKTTVLKLTLTTETSKCRIWYFISVWTLLVIENATSEETLVSFKKPL